MPIDLLAFTPPEAADAVRQQLLNGGIRLGRAAAGSWAGGGAGGAAGGAAAGGARASIRVLTPTEVDCALDKLFDGGCRDEWVGGGEWVFVKAVGWVLGGVGVG